MIIPKERYGRIILTCNWLRRAINPGGSELCSMEAWRPWGGPVGHSGVTEASLPIITHLHFSQLLFGWPLHLGKSSVDKWVPWLKIKTKQNPIVSVQKLWLTQLLYSCREGKNYGSDRWNDLPRSGSKGTADLELKLVFQLPGWRCSPKAMLSPRHLDINVVWSFRWPKEGSHMLGGSGRWYFQIWN